MSIIYASACARLRLFGAPVHMISLQRIKTSVKSIQLRPAQDLPTNDYRRSEAMQDHIQRCHHSLQLLHLFIYISHY